MPTQNFASSRFTLIEILGVLIIILIVAGFIVGGVGLVTRKADEAKAKSQLGVFDLALESYKAERGYFPIKPTSALTQTWIENNLEAFGLHLNESPFDGDELDPWGNAWTYGCPGTMNPERYDLWSRGRDGDHGDGGSSYTDAYNLTAMPDDISNWRVR